MVESGIERRASVHDLERPRNEQVGDPLCRHRNRHCLALDRVGEDLRQQHPHDRTPRERESGDVQYHPQKPHHAGIAGQMHRARHAGPGIREQEAEQYHRHRHDQRTGDEERLAAPPVHQILGDDGEDHHRHADAHRIEEGGLGAEAEVLEHQRGVIKHRIDADELLKDGKKNADDQHRRAET